MRSLFYRSLKYYCRIVLWFYFKQWQITNKNKVPAGPVIFVANHQNAFLDAVVAACSTHRNIWFLARAGVFEKKWAKQILSWLQMMPVFRFRDGYSTIKKNDQTFETCIDLLTKGESILIFAEGNHDDHWRLRPLQKGFARIALGAEEKNNWSLGVKIIPVGIQYEDKHDSLSRVLVTFGDAISVKEIVDRNDPVPEQINNLITYTTHQLQPLILHIDEGDYRQKVDYLFHYRIRVKDLKEQLAIDQALLQSYAVDDSVQPRKTRKRFWNPFYTYWFLNTLIAWLLIQWVLKRKIEDPQFTASLKFSIGMALVPLFCFLQSFVVYYFTQSWEMTALYIVLIPVSIKIHSLLI